MAEMTAAEAIRMALKFNRFDVAGVITCMTTQLDGMKQKESAYKQVIESKKALIEQQAAELATAKKAYYDVADCICRESSSVEDLCIQARGLRETIERQAAEIERMNQTWPNSCDFKDDDGCCLFPGAMTPECHADACSVIKGLKQEIAKNDRMLKKAIDKLFILPGRDECPDDVLCPVTLPNTPDIGVCRKCWLAWLESEAEAHE